MQTASTGINLKKKLFSYSGLIFSHTLPTFSLFWISLDRQKPQTVMVVERRIASLRY